MAAEAEAVSPKGPFLSDTKEKSPPSVKSETISPFFLSFLLSSPLISFTATPLRQNFLGLPPLFFIILKRVTDCVHLRFFSVQKKKDGKLNAV